AWSGRGRQGQQGQGRRVLQGLVEQISGLRAVAEAAGDARALERRLKPLLIVVGQGLIDLPGDDIEVRRVRAIPAAAALEPGRPTVVLVDAQVWGDLASLVALTDSAAIIARGTPDDEGAPTDLLAGYISPQATRAGEIALLRGAFRHAASLVAVQT